MRNFRPVAIAALFAAAACSAPAPNATASEAAAKPSDAIAAAVAAPTRTAANTARDAYRLLDRRILLNLSAIAQLPRSIIPHGPQRPIRFEE